MSNETWIKQREETTAEMTKSPPEFSPVDEQARISEFVRELVRRAKADGVVVGISGGIDSAVVTALCAKALGKDRVLGLLLPSATTPDKDMEDARRLAAKLGIRTKEVNVSKIVGALVDSVRFRGTRIENANVQARARMMVLYFFANSENLLVAGTGDRSEIEIGFFTKYGDGGVDFLPIGHLYKTQVRDLAISLGFPRSITTKQSSPNLWPGHKATDEIPVDYDKLDLVLHNLLDGNSPRRLVAEKAGVEISTVDEVLQRRRITAHKRSLPPTLPDWEKTSRYGGSATISDNERTKD